MKGRDVSYMGQYSPMALPDAGVFRRRLAPNPVHNPCPCQGNLLWTGLMIEKLAKSRGWVSSEFLDLNHTSKGMILVSLLIPKFARDASIEFKRTSETGHWRQFADRDGGVV